MSSFADCLAMSPGQGFGSTLHQKSGLADCLAASRGQGFGWSKSQMSSFADCLAMSRGQGFGWSKNQMSSFTDCLVMSPGQGFGWTPNLCHPIQCKLFLSLTQDPRFRNSRQHTGRLESGHLHGPHNTPPLPSHCCTGPTNPILENAEVSMKIALILMKMDEICQCLHPTSNLF